ncbi:FUSC family membrane protein [Flammeovirgaceae bacterium SG7u.111]|nr:FUSC family membrane protein [Flammeovirgaceae bacterium SG7u.132]WPO37254.1 FUSC family membrane protein [Flammeovirgaceae bacterium SG7u.111]
MRYNSLKQAFWRHPNRLLALRSTVSMALVSIPFILLDGAFFGVTLALGAMAGALSETDDHPQGRLKTLGLTVLSFFISSFMIGLLYHNPWWLGCWFIVSTLAFILIGGIDERYRAITFGSIQIGVYAMLGADTSPAWYWGSVLLSAGALLHGLISLFLLYRRPWRLLDVYMARGFLALSNYLKEKARLFPSEEKDQIDIRNNLALLNIEMVSALEKIKEVLNNYDEEVEDKELLRPYLQRFMLLQSLHERAASSHERYEVLYTDEESRGVVEGLGEMLRQFAYAIRQLSDDMLNGATYRHPMVLDWISTALETKLQAMDEDKAEPLVLLHHNLSRSHLSLKHLDDLQEGSSIPRLRKDERSLGERLRAQLTFKHPRMRYAIRLSICFLVGYILVQALELEKGAWVMLTSLFVSQISYSETRRRLFQRVLGTVMGVVIGVLLIQIFPTKVGQLVLLLISGFAFFYWVRTRYSRAVLFITIFVLCGFNLISGAGGATIMTSRLIDTLIGASLAFLVARYLWPGWQYHRLPVLISLAMAKNAAYFKAIVKEYDQASPDDLAYRIARREAHRADNELATAWRTMQVEPKRKRKFMQYAFTFTYLNHALLSYISALGIHRSTYDLSFENAPEMTTKLGETMTEAGELLSGNSSVTSTDLVPVLHSLRQQILSIPSSLKKQQLRVFYNITDVTMKLVAELEKIKKEG